MSNKSAILPAKLARLVVQSTKIPTPTKDELLLRIHSAAVNPVDYKIQSTGRFFEDFPRVLGSDAAGIVEAVGPDQKRFKKGDKVFSFVPIFNEAPTTEYGSFQQYTLALDATTATLPSNTSFDSASTIPLALATAADGLYRVLQLPEPVVGTKLQKSSGDWLLVWGGASSVGQFAIQLAVASGYKVITTASPASHDDLKKLGAAIVVNYRDSDVVKQIETATEGSLKLIYDAVATAESVPQTLAALPHGGKVAYTQLTPETLKLDASENITYDRVFAANLQKKDARLGRVIFDWAAQALQDGTLVGNPVKLRDGGVDGVQETLDYYRENGISNGKYVFHV